MHNRPPHEIFLVISLRKQNSRRSIAKGGASDLAFRIFPDTSHRQRERFKNKLMKDFCAKYKIKQVRGDLYTRKSNLQKEHYDTQSNQGV